jgi:uncharacterized sulfatase
MPGINLLPSAKGKEALAPNRPVFGEIYPGDASVLGHPERDVAYRWVRHRDLKLIIPHPDTNGSAWNKYVKGIALFDLKSDSDEKKNLANDPVFQDDVARLTGLLDNWWPIRR